MVLASRSFRGLPPFAPFALAASAFASDFTAPRREPTLIDFPQCGHFISPQSKPFSSLFHMVFQSSPLPELQVGKPPNIIAFTAEPWDTEDDVRGGSPYIICRNFDGGVVQVADLQFVVDGVSDGEMDANVLLIREAPAMYRLLKETLSEMKLGEMGRDVAELAQKIENTLAAATLSE